MPYFMSRPEAVEAEQFDGYKLPFASRDACRPGPVVISADGTRTPLVAGDWVVSEPGGFSVIGAEAFAERYPVACEPDPRDAEIARLRAELSRANCPVHRLSAAEERLEAIYD